MLVSTRAETIAKSYPHPIRDRRRLPSDIRYVVGDSSLVFAGLAAAALPRADD